MIYFTDLLISFWWYAQETAAYVLNRIPSKAVPSTPYEIWIDRKSSLKHLNIWGYPAYVKNIVRHKLSARSEKYKFVGYPQESIGYYFYESIEPKIIISRHATFLEKEFIQEGATGRTIEL